MFGGSITKVMLVLGDAQVRSRIVGTAPAEAGLGDVLRRRCDGPLDPGRAPPNDDLPYRFTEALPCGSPPGWGNVVLLTEEGTVGLDRRARR